MGSESPLSTQLPRATILLRCIVNIHATKNRGAYTTCAYTLVGAQAGHPRARVTNKKHDEFRWLSTLPGVTRMTVRRKCAGAQPTHPQEIFRFP